MRCNILEIFFNWVDNPRELRLHNHDLGIGIVDDIFHLPSHQPKIDRYNDEPGFGRGQIDFDHFDAVVHEHGHLVAFYQAEVDKTMSQLVYAPIGFRIGEAACLIFQC